MQNNNEIAVKQMWYQNVDCIRLAAVKAVLTLYVAPEAPNLWASLTVIRLRIRNLFRGCSVRDLLVIPRVMNYFDNTQNSVKG